MTEVPRGPWGVIAEEIARVLRDWMVFSVQTSMSIALAGLTGDDMVGKWRLGVGSRLVDGPGMISRRRSISQSTTRS